MTKYRAIISGVFFLLGCLATNSRGRPAAAADSPAVNQEKKQQEEHYRPKEEEIYHFENQQVVINDFPAQGFILAIGGGGEGIMGQLKGSQVVAIDIIKRELEDAPEGPLKIVMDAKDLKFIDGSFNTAASFFTLMYIPGSDHPKVFEEVARVLKPGGKFLIWDMVFPKQPDPQKKVGVVRLSIKLPDRTVNTGYGVFWPDKVHDAAYYEGLGKAAGLTVAKHETTGGWFYLELQKP